MPQERRSFKTVIYMGNGNWVIPYCKEVLSVIQRAVDFVWADTDMHFRPVSKGKGDNNVYGQRGRSHLDMCTGWNVAKWWWLRRMEFLGRWYWYYAQMFSEFCKLFGDKTSVIIYCSSNLAYLVHMVLMNVSEGVWRKIVNNSRSPTGFLSVTG